MPQLTKREKRLKTWSLLWGILFLLTDAVFILYGQTMLRIINKIGWFFNFRYPIDEAGGTFWLILASANMIVISFVCLKVFINVRKNYSLIQIILVSKLASSLVAIAFFRMIAFHFAYLVIFFVDLVIFFIFLALYISVAIESKEESSHDAKNP